MAERAQGGRKRPWRRWIVAAGVLALVVLSVDRFRRREPALTGALRPDGLAEPADNELGDFRLSWVGDALEIRHSADPDRVLWSTLPGESLLQAARGEEVVQESRGLFRISDRLRDVCADQTFESMASAGEALEICGRLHCRSGEEISYRFTLRPAGEGRLIFSAVLEGAANRLYLTYGFDPEERFLGFGTQFSHFDLKGRWVPILVSEQGIGRGLQPLAWIVDAVAGAGGDWHHSYAGVPTT